MAKEFPVTDVYYYGVSELAAETEGERMLPVVYIPEMPGAVRTNSAESIYQQALEFGGIYKTEGVLVGLTANPSPHTTEMIPRDLFLEAIRTIRHNANPQLPFEGDQVPAHLIAWMWGEGLSRVDLTYLGSLPAADREKYFEATEREVVDAIKILRRSLNIETSEEKRRIRHYGVFGIGTEEERKKTGGARGAQSVIDGHSSVAYLPRGAMTKQAEIRPVEIGDVMKQMGVFDTVVTRQISQPERKRIKQIVMRRLPNIPKVVVTSGSEHGDATDGSEIIFHEGVTLRFPDGLTYTEAMQVLTDYIGDREDLYQGLRKRNELYHKNRGNPAAVEAIKGELREYLASKGYEDKSFAKRLINMALGTQPTRIQVDRWIEDLKAEGRTEDDPSLKRLETKKKAYERLLGHMSLPDRKPNIQYFDFLHKVLQNNFGMDQLESEMFARMLYDTVKTPEYVDSRDNNIEFTWPVHFSGSYIIDNYKLDEHGKMKIFSMTIASKLGSTKGALEDLMRVAVSRRMAL